jgi:hypothetical protein
LKTWYFLLNVIFPEGPKADGGEAKDGCEVNLKTDADLRSDAKDGCNADLGCDAKDGCDAAALEWIYGGGYPVTAMECPCCDASFVDAKLYSRHVNVAHAGINDVGLLQ